MKGRIGRLWMGFVTALVAPALCLAQDNPAADQFESHVRPLLVAKCLECHGDTDPEGQLRLTSLAHLLKGGEHGPALVPGNPDQSLLMRVVGYEGDIKMPPSGKLSEREIEALSRWIKAGAPWPQATVSLEGAAERRVTAADRQHWAFRPLLRPTLPDRPDDRWSRSSVDRWIYARWPVTPSSVTPLREPEVGLASGHALSASSGLTVDRRTLLRRVHLDLVGLPPTWEEMEEFAEDPGLTDELLGRVVDRLLASPRHGERWGRHWLDVARFADTKDGVLMYGDDRIRPFAYTYRDYVIRAFNEDLPFDRFVHEQLAADLLQPRVEPWRLAALGLLTLGRMYDNNVHDIIDDQIDVVSRGFLGLTVACARCHDHKYDPVPMADYYSLYGVFASCESPLEPPLIDDPARFAGGVEFEQQAAAKRADLRKFVDDQYALLSETARHRTADYLVRVATTRPDPLETAIFFLSLAPEDLRPPIVARWRRLIDQRARPDDPVFAPWAALMALPEGDPAEFARRAAEWLEGAATQPRGVKPGELNPLVWRGLRDVPLASRADVARAYGELLLRAWAAAEGDAKRGAEVDGASAARVPAAPADSLASPESGDDAARRQLVELLVGPSSPNYFPKSQTRRYMSRQETDAYGGKVRELDLMAVRSPAAPPRAMVLQDAALAVDPRVFHRGNPSQPGRVVPRQFLEIATTSTRSPFGDGSGRLELARAITSPDNPLAARVIVNRVWMWHFGEPLVTTPSDFGTRSDAPVQAELLDWLASDLLRRGWSLKSLHRELVLSNVYRLPARSEWSDALRQTDPENRLLSRIGRRRLDWEAMRDTLLAVSGRLEHRGAGRPVDVAYDPLNRSRTVYGLVDRQSLPGVMRAFDFATPDQSVERRPRTVVPQQALFALNSPFLMEQARSLIGRPDVASLQEPEQKITRLYRIVLTRDPSEGEMVDAREFVQLPGEGSRLSRWELLAQVLLSCNELMYVD